MPETVNVHSAAELIETFTNKLKPSSVEEITLNNSLEYVERVLAERVIRRCYRTLAEDGFLRISCVNLEKACEAYLDSLGSAASDDLNDKTDKLVKLLYGGKKYGYNLDTMRRFLLSVGFTTVDSVMSDDDYKMSLIAWKGPAEATELKIPWS